MNKTNIEITLSNLTIEETGFVPKLLEFTKNETIAKIEKIEL